MRIILAACVVCLFWSPAAWAGELKDGIYLAHYEGKGQRLKCADGVEIILGEEIGTTFGKTTTIRSMDNDNTQFYLDMRDAGPVSEKAGRGATVLIIAGVPLRVWGCSNRGPDGNMGFSCTIHGTAAAQKIAKHLKVDVHLRKNPGHRLEVRWTPEKESFRVGEKINLKMEIRNVGAEAMAFQVGGQQRGSRDNQFRFLAYRSAGGGESVPDTGDPEHWGGRGFLKILKPGETFSRTVELNDWFTFTEPDTYSVTGIYELAFYDPAAERMGPVIWSSLAAGECLVRIEKSKQ